MQLAQFAGLWSLVHHPSRAREWSLDQKLRHIKKAGFTGVSARLDSTLATLAREQGLFLIGLVFADDPTDYPRLLRTQKEFGARHINVQLGPADLPPTEAARRWIAIEKTAEKLGLTASLETHRDSATATAEALFALAGRYTKLTGRTLRITWDFSQHALAGHLHAANFAEKLLSRPELVQHATQFHFRPFNGHHAQLPVTHRGKLTPETRDYLDFVSEVFRVWKSAPHNRDETLLACPALGPRIGYALTGFPPVWPDALTLSHELSTRWKSI